jgi:GNAT superfamily N-acetyltransferase
MSPGVVVLPMRADQWRELRAVRLEMLAESPLAYIESLRSARALPDAEWQERARRYTAAPSLNLVAVDSTVDSSVDSDGRWVGTMSGYVDESAGRAWLAAVYVAPDHRGRGPGIADALLDGIEDWARRNGRPQLWLEVHEDNLRAHRFYLRRGYEFTGATRPYELDPTRLEREMVRAL